MEQTYSNKETQSRANSNEIGNENVLTTQRKSLSPPNLLFASQTHEGEESYEQVEIAAPLSQLSASESSTNSEVQLKSVSNSPNENKEANTDFIEEGNTQFELDIPPTLPPPHNFDIQLKINTNSTSSINDGHSDQVEKLHTQKDFDDPVILPPLQAKLKSNENQESNEIKQGMTSSDGLPPPLLAKMNASFGDDFSNVKVHKESPQALQMGALAFAQGTDVHFAPGQYEPNSRKGQELIGHELTHVVQQKQGRVKPTKQLKSGLSVNDDPALEKEADEQGAKAANNTTSFLNQKEQGGFSLSNNLAQKKEKDVQLDEKIGKDNSKTIEPNRLALELEPYLGGSKDDAITEVFRVKNAVGPITSKLKAAKWQDIQLAKNYFYNKTGKKLEQLLIENMGNGVFVPIELVSSIYYVRNDFNELLHHDLGICMLAGKIEAEILIGVLEREKISLVDRKRIRTDYDKTFFESDWNGKNLSHAGFTMDIKDKFSDDNEKKILALLDHELTNADELVYHITGNYDSKGAISVVTNALENGNGFKGIKILEDNWKKYINQNLPGVNYVFHNQPLFQAVKSTFGEKSQVWKIVAPIEKNYKAWCVGKSEKNKTKKESKNQENELLLDSALNVVISFRNHYEAQRGYRFETKNYDDSILWAIRTLKKVMPEIIEASETFSEKHANENKWEYIKTIIKDTIKITYKGNKEKQALHELDKETDSSTPWVDDFYIAINSGNKKKSVSLANKIWAHKQVDELHEVLGSTERRYLGSELKGRAGRRSELLVSKMIARGQSAEYRGYLLLRFEIMENEPDLNFLKDFIDQTGSINRGLLDASIAIFMQKESLLGISSHLQKGSARSHRQLLLEIIKYKKYTKNDENWVSNTTSKSTKKPTAEFLKLKHSLVPPQTNDEKVAYADEYANMQGTDSNHKGVLADLELSRIHSINDNAEGAKDLTKQTGESLDENLDISGNELTLRLDAARKELEKDAAFAAFVVEMAVYVAVVAISGGTASGLLIATLTSKAAEMVAKKELLGEKYELVTQEHFNTLAISGLTEIASMGLSSKFKAFQKTNEFKKYAFLGQSMTKVTEEVATQILSKSIEAVVNEKLPDFGDASLTMAIDAFASILSVDSIIEEHKKYKNAILDYAIIKAPNKVANAFASAALKGEEIDMTAVGKDLAFGSIKMLGKANNKKPKADEVENE